MSIDTSYGTWWNYIGTQNAEEIVVNCLSGGEREWREAMEAAGADKAIAEEIRQAVDAALPEGVRRSGEEFYGPMDGDCDLSFLREVVDSLDMAAMIAKYDVDNQPQPDPELYVYEQDTASDLNRIKNGILDKVEKAKADLAALPANSKSYNARRYRDYIASAPKRIADLDRLIAIVQDSRQG